jgi:predicted thioesterase
MKVKAIDTGKFVTVYTEGEGKMDAVLLEVVEDVCEVWYPHLQNDNGGVGSRNLVEASTIVSIGPPVAVHVPLF